MYLPGYTAAYYNLLLRLGEQREAAGELDLRADKVGQVGHGERVLEALLDAALVGVRAGAGRPATNALEEVAPDLGVTGVLAGVDGLDVLERVVDEGRELRERGGERGEGRERGRRGGVARGEEVDCG
jgi:hypothetical protein